MDYPPEATFYVRLSLMNPKPGQDERVSRLMDDLLQFFPSQPGFVRAYKLVREYPDPKIGRVTVWKSEQDADKAANQQHVLSTRSELLEITEQEYQIERSYTAYDPQLADASAS